MNRTVRIAALHFVLIAMIARALVPNGWMPSNAQLGEAAFIICTADGSVQHGAPSKDDGAKAHQPCAFASAAKLLEAPVGVSIAPPSSGALVIDGVIAPTAPLPHAARAHQVPRAPPLFA